MFIALWDKWESWKKNNKTIFERGSIEIRHGWIDEMQTNLAVGIFSSCFIKKKVFIYFHINSQCENKMWTRKGLKKELWIDPVS